MLTHELYVWKTSIERKPSIDRVRYISFRTHNMYIQSADGTSPCNFKWLHILKEHGQLHNNGLVLEDGLEYQLASSKLFDAKVPLIGSLWHIASFFFPSS